MCSASFALSAFGDEIDQDFETQLRVMRDLRIGRLDLRGAWGVSVLDLSDEQASAIHRICTEYGIEVCCLGSPIGKSPILEPIEKEAANLVRLFEIGRAVGTRRIRVFSFYPPDRSSNTGYDAYVQLSAERLAHLTKMAAAAGFLLLLENEKDIVTDTPDRCHAVLQIAGSADLRFTWDPANFVQVGVARPMAAGWQMLKRHVSHVHIKDALLVDGSVQPAGMGDGEVRELLSGLRVMGYQGDLCLEPHLTFAGSSGGISGPEGMAIAAAALRKLMEDTGCEERVSL
jgi:sugar phosphate isomerase/epimerase